MVFEIYKDTIRQYRWRLKAANSEIIASGESYVDKANAIHAVNLIKKFAQTAEVVDRTLLSRYF